MRSRILALASFVSLALLMNACGGGGGTSTTGGTSGCTASTYTPNYVADVSLGHFNTYPVTVYFDTGAQWTQARQDAFTAGMDRWIAAMPVGSRPSYTVSPDPNAQLRVSFVLQSALGSNTLGITTPHYYPSTGEISYSTVQIGVTLPGGAVRSDAAVRNTCAHEFGHAIGIFGHSPTYADQMYAYDDGHNQFFVTTADVNTMMTAYCGTFGRDIPVTSHKEPLVSITIRD